MSERQQLNRFIGAAIATLVLFTACGGDDDDGAERAAAPDTTTTTEPAAVPDQNTSWVAQAKDGVPEVDVYAEPGGAQPTHQLENPKRVDEAGNQAPLVFLVEGTEVSGDWIPVHLPVPPNGSTGFVRADDVDLYAHNYRIAVELGAHRLTLTEGEEIVLEATVGLGRAGRETPAGLYFVTELLEAPDPTGPYGPFAYGISGFQDDEEVRAEFGGEAVIGIHGTNEPDKLGEAVSSGCIRVNNDVITEMAGILPLGVPVEVIA
jgi:lipoprotein-anchoring transpeptidase ErfK/SrfK